MTGPFCANRLHLQRGEDCPEAVYVIVIGNCRHVVCKTRTTCLGHYVCADCGNMMRTGKAAWGSTQVPAELVTISSTR